MTKEIPPVLYEKICTSIQKWLDDISKKTGIERCFIQEYYEKCNKWEKKDEKRKKRECPYEFVSGARKGQQCGAGIRDPLQMYCSRHKNHKNHKNDENDGNDKNEKQKNGNKEQKSINKKQAKQEMVKHITRLHPKIKKYIHESTGMVFISKEEKIVFGHWDGENVHPLTDDDKQVCFIYHFRVDDTRYDEQIKIINSE